MPLSKHMTFDQKKSLVDEIVADLFTAQTDDTSAQKNKESSDALSEASSVKSNLRLSKLGNSQKNCLLSILSNLLIGHGQNSIDQDSEGCLIDEETCNKLRQMCLKAFHSFFTNNGGSNRIDFEVIVKTYGRLLF